MKNHRTPLTFFALLFIVIGFHSIDGFAQNVQSSRPSATELWRQVEVIRTAYGVPHIRARNLKAAGYALAWLQSEDYGPQTGMRLLEASGRSAMINGATGVESDFAVDRNRRRAKETYRLLEKNTRDIYEGFAAGVNRYVVLNPSEFPAVMPSDFTGVDVATLDIIGPSPAKIRTFLNRLNPPTGPQRPAPNDNNEGEEEHPDDGSNTWAFAPSRTKSGNAILMRNPHLNWNAGYYEAHMTVPGVIDFYGDFRIGGPFSVIGGFNRDLGWSTTNNRQDLDQIYTLDADPKAANQYIFDGISVSLKRDVVSVKVKNGDSFTTETREFWSTPLGPVIHRADGKIYVIKSAKDGEYRAGEQFLRMMRAKTFSEWKAVMKTRARLTSNFTYADRAGNIFMVWNAALPLLPHAPVDDTVALPARGKSDVWSKYVPFESLPQFLNPKGGYVHNENSSPHFTNMRTPVNLTDAYPNFEEPHLSLRSQLAIQLVGGDERFSLQDIVKLKNNYRAILADRVKPDLVTAVKAVHPSPETAAAIATLEKWNNDTAPDSKGAVLFQIWWTHYSGIRPPDQRTALPDNRRYAKVWKSDDPLNTPVGLADTARAVESFSWAVAETKRLYGSVDVTWGDVHRVRRGKIDVPVGGCGNDLGCFRILSFNRDPDGKLAANSGDAWVLAVEFGKTPRAYSVNAYGQSRLPDSPYHADQAEMFAKGEYKKVVFTQTDVNAQAIKRYRPGEKK